MLPDTTVVRDYFAKLGLAEEIADLYLALYKNGPQTISALSRHARVERTKIYRLIDQLLASGLIEVESHSKRGIIKAAPISNIRILISQKEQELQSLHSELGLLEKVMARNSLSSPATRVQFYTGPEGYKQMMWNETKARAEVRCIVYEIAQPKTNKAFFERWVEQCNQKGVAFREVHGDAFRKSHDEWHAANVNAKLKNYDPRYIDPKIFPITHSMDIYDNVVAYYNWKDGEIFGIEIYNQDIADAQGIFFELLWSQAQQDRRHENDPKQP